MAHFDELKAQYRGKLQVMHGDDLKVMAKALNVPFKRNNDRFNIMALCADDETVVRGLKLLENM